MNDDSLKPKILIVDDQPENIKILSELLKTHYISMAAINGMKALECAFSDDRPDLILLDIMMPGIDGYEVCRRLKEDPRTNDIPVIFITALGDQENETRGFEGGAVDYIVKPFNPAIVEARIKTHLALKQYQQHLKQMVDLQTAELAQSNAQLKTTLSNLKREIGIREAAEIRLRSSESQLVNIINTFNGFIYRCSYSSYMIDFANQQMKDYLGAQTLKRLCHKAVFDSDAPCPFCPMALTLKGQTVEREIESARDHKWYYAIFSPVFDAAGRVQRQQAILLDITRRKQLELDLQAQKESLSDENRILKASMKNRYQFGPIIGKSLLMQHVYETIIKAAASEANVIIYGESGTGKELVAKSIHANSKRSAREMISVNCAAIPANLMESEFFGHKKGAFSGADKDKAGHLDAVHNSTLFLDEISEISLALQVKLLRAIEGGGYTAIGSSQVKKPDFRLISATNKDLNELIGKGVMREDFYYRIHIIPIHLPPLRDRLEDIPLLIDHFLKEDFETEENQIPGSIMDTFMRYHWPGNVRELRNAVHRYITLQTVEFLEPVKTMEPPGESDSLIFDSHGQSLQESINQVEAKLIDNALKQNRWRKGDTARSLGIDPKTLYRKIKQYHLKDV